MPQYLANEYIKSTFLSGIILSFFYVFSISANATIKSPVRSYNELKVYQADLKQYPDNKNDVASREEITIGDLHGNAIKLIYFLLTHGVIELSETSYHALVDIYHKEVTSLDEQDIANYLDIISKARINRHAKLRFLGDDLCDRGSNDYFTLKVFEKLAIEQVDFEIVLSNHGSFFLKAYEREEKSFSYNPYGEGKHESLVSSMLNLQKLIDMGLVSKHEVITLVDTYYLSHIQPIAYTLNKEENEFTFYTHAPVDLKIVQNIANDLNIGFTDATLDELALTFDRINSTISKWIRQGNYTKHYDELKDNHKKNETKSPLEQLIWNRDYTIIDRIEKNHDYTLNYVHGHDSEENVFSLDTQFGKGLEKTKGSYAIYYTRAASDKQPRKPKQ
jgi:WipA-like, phosphatase domain